MRKRSIPGMTAVLLISGVMLMGAGCGKQATNSANRNTSGTNNSNTTQEVTVEDPGQPTGNEATDEATIEKTLNQMQDASDYATTATNSVENGDDVDSYSLPQDVE